MEVTDEERPLIHHLSPQDEDSQYTRDGTVDINDQPAQKQSTGNWRACFMILGAEFTECMAFFAIGKNLVTFLTAELHETNVDAARNVSSWIGSCFLTPVIGAFLADTYWGRYKTIVIFLLIYIIGMLILTVSASLPFIVDVPSNSGIRRVSVYLGLYLVALGTGGIKPCTSALGADQFDGADPVERATKGSFFNWYYFSVNIGSLLSGTVLVWVQQDIGWGVGFAVPMVLMMSGLAVFVAGRKVYRYKQLGVSPLTRVAQVVVAAVRNYRVVLHEDTSGGIEHSRQFRGEGSSGGDEPMETLHGVPGGGAEDAATDVARLGFHGALLRRHSADVVDAHRAGRGHGQPRRPVHRPSGVPGNLRRHQRHDLHPRLRRRAGAAGPARHRQGPRPVAAAAHRRRPRAVRGRHGVRGAGGGAEAGARAGQHAGDEHHVAGAGVRRAGRGGGVRLHRHPRVLLR
ncbi:protein NRT1/ PTR FAMILY 8.3-like isoform X2 [Panicum virgatum]|uniref:protein NRT1/ PTR FAMILY 8.3-like isoform X2 n=1 Tax=Panicum virgatum TaxID=38727 RepID=UPI0019D6522F|nr:protein NRT1/ PTR FAMILY 8.3-like isoform X2 [Panicum virgatum]